VNLALQEKQLKQSQLQDDSIQLQEQKYQKQISSLRSYKAQLISKLDEAKQELANLK